MVKKLIRGIVHSLGLDIVRYQRAKESIKTDRLTLYHTTTGEYYLPSDAGADIVANTIIRNQIFEEEVVNLASRYIRPGSTVLDVGANFGQMSILFSGMVGADGHVYSFEADDFVFEILKKNVKVNCKESVIRPIFGAVHNHDGDTLFFPEQNFKEFGTYGSYGIDYNADRGRTLKSITIDSLDIQTPISLMKIDIQGGDLQAMKGALRTIEKHKMPILFEYEYHFEERYNFNFQQYVDFVASINYKFERVLSGHNFLITPANN